MKYGYLCSVHGRLSTNRGGEGKMRLRKSQGIKENGNRRAPSKKDFLISVGFKKSIQNVLAHCHFEI